MIKDWQVDASNRIENWVFDGDNVTLTAAQVESRIVGNRAPVAAPLADQLFGAGQSFSFTAPAFTDPNGDALSYSARQVGGVDLPAWLTFNATTRTFSGVIPSSGASEFQIEFLAEDPTGFFAKSSFALARLNTINGTALADNITGTEGRDNILA